MLIFDIEITQLVISSFIKNLWILDLRITFPMLFNARLCCVSGPGTLPLRCVSGVFWQSIENYINFQIFSDINGIFKYFIKKIPPQN